jgi:pimeloyl-ACP methyl ester carboxylesterase
MPRIVVVNGVGDNHCRTWRAGLRAGLITAGFHEYAPVDAGCVSYRDVFWPTEATPRQRIAEDERAHEALAAWYVRHRWTDERRGGLSWPARHALRVIGGHCQFCSDLLVFGIAKHFTATDLRLVRRYFAEPDRRAAAQERIARKITPDTRILIGHSFGSVIAYEALCAHPEWPVRLLITLGSPLGIQALITSRLRPVSEGSARRWPGSIARWVNVSDPRDIFSVTSALDPIFGPGVEDHFVNNGAHPHDLIRYLAAEVTGRAIGSFEELTEDAPQLAITDSKATVPA